MHLLWCQEDDKHHKWAKPIWKSTKKKPEVNKSFSSTSNNPLNQLHVFALHTWLTRHKNRMEFEWFSILFYFFLPQIYPDGQSLSESCQLKSLQSMLDPSEASKHQLNVNTDKKELSKSFCAEEDRLTVVAFETNDSPSAIAMLKTLNVLSLMEPLPPLEIHRDILHTTCKTMWELSYGIQRIDKKGKCLGDICIAAGLEMLYNLNVNERYTIYRVHMASISRQF